MAAVAWGDPFLGGTVAHARPRGGGAGGRGPTGTPRPTSSDCAVPPSSHHPGVVGCGPPRHDMDAVEAPPLHTLDRGEGGGASANGHSSPLRPLRRPPDCAVPPSTKR